MPPAGASRGRFWIYAMRPESAKKDVDGRNKSGHDEVPHGAALHWGYGL